MTPRYPIEEGFEQLVTANAVVLRRSEFRDPLLASLNKVRLSARIDSELERIHSATANAGAVAAISRVFRRLRGRES